jgi:hypothetical protein
MNVPRVSAALISVALAGTVALAGAAPASAKGGSRAAEARGKCSAGAVWKLKAKPDNGRMQVELEVDSNRNGQTWAVRITDNGVAVFSGKRVTHAPSGSFSIELRTANRSGRDAFVGTARDVKTGQLCTARVTY